MSRILAAGAARMKLEAENYEARIAALEAQLAELAAENERLKKLLAGRDIYIVDQGLWGDFVARLPVTNTVDAHETANLSDKPEGWQEAGRIGDAVLDWMVKFDLLDAGNEYCVSDVLAVLNDLTPSTRPSEQAVTEAMVEAALGEWFKSEVTWSAGMAPATKDQMFGDMRAALKAAMEAGG